MPWSSGSPCSSSLARVTAAASSRRTSVPWSAWCTCADTTPSRSWRLASVSPSALPTPTRQPSSTCSPHVRPACCVRCAKPTLTMLLDGTLAECDRVGDGRADYSHKHRRHGVNVQVVTDSAGQCARTARPCPRPGRGPHPPDHPDLRTPGHPGARRPRLPGRRSVGDHTGQTPTRPRPVADPANGQPRALRGAGTGRARCGPAESVAGLPQSPVQPKSNVVNRRGYPHPGAATLKELSDRSVSAGERGRFVMSERRVAVALDADVERDCRVDGPC
jgi:hypothetical protein